MSHTITRHAQVRMCQRALRQADIDLVLSCGARVTPDAYLMTRTDIRREVATLYRRIRRVRHGRLEVPHRDTEIAALKRQIQRIECLKNVKVVVEGETVVTVYRSGVVDQRRTLRRGRNRK